MKRKSCSKLSIACLALIIAFAAVGCKSGKNTGLNDFSGTATCVAYSVAVSSTRQSFKAEAKDNKFYKNDEFFGSIEQSNIPDTLLSGDFSAANAEERAEISGEIEKLRKVKSGWKVISELSEPYYIVVAEGQTYLCDYHVSDTSTAEYSLFIYKLN